MSALDWYKKMTEAPRLVHTDGLVLVQLGEDSVLFPSEADARFFYDAYADVPALEAQNDHLRSQIDEQALNEALTRCAALEAETAALGRALGELRAQNAALAERAASAVRHAKVLAHAITNGIKP